MKAAALVLLVLLSIPASGHGVFSTPYGNGMYLTNPTNHYHNCRIGKYYFDLYPGQTSRVYPPGPWGCN